MKFAKELERDLVPEWRSMYLDYKAGKKHVKRVARAIQRANATPATPGRARPTPPTQSSGTYGTMSSFSRLGSSVSGRNGKRTATWATTPEHGEGYEQMTTDSLGTIQEPREDEREGSPQQTHKSPAVDIPQNSSVASQLEMYGSFVPTPSPTARPDFLQLPDPAMSIRLDDETEEPRNRFVERRSISHSNIRRDSNGRASNMPNQSQPPSKSAFSSLRHFSLSRHNSSPGNGGKNFLRFKDPDQTLTKTQSHRSSISLGAIDQVRAQQREFFTWMDGELEKIETFYKSKENQAGERLQVLREQLHIMRNRRLDELNQMRLSAKRAKSNSSGSDDDAKETTRKRLTQINSALQPLKEMFHDVRHQGKLGPNSRALQSMAHSPDLRRDFHGATGRSEGGRDYVRRPVDDNGVSYRSAKRKLKTAIQEYYRGLELLKAYALLNRTAFRKINKKYDKAVHARPPLRYMNQKVNKAWFVQSEVLDNYLHDVEDLYARYFEGGNHKVAVGKLRSSANQHTDYSGVSFETGLLIGIGAVFAVQAVVFASELLRDADPTVRTQTSYLLQIYGGYFLGIYLFSWFCIDCSVWARNKINYGFVFEFDRRHELNWRELSQFPAFMFLLLGLFMWVNFTRYGTQEMYIYFPVILIFVSLVIIFFPAPVLYHHSRKWFAYSHWRLFLAGLYPVEFRDFFLGDMYCSLTYLTSNIELFFCLYANYWNNPTQCNSTHSRLLGFFSALPGIWRALQCIRRYYDTRNVFPHLVNCGKYSMTILYYVSLSLYRIDKSRPTLAIFITLASINAVYCSLWDLLMDWSLCQPQARKPLLRDVRGFKSSWWYYFAMVIDPILRFNWVFYIIYTHDVQHSTTASFFISFSEVTRRGIWTLFRVENEHCANVAHFKASRDVPLPYPVESEAHSPEQVAASSTEATTTAIDQSSATTPRRRAGSGADLEAPPSVGSLRRRPHRTLTMIFAEAHTQDFEKKRKPVDMDEDVAKLERDDSDNAKESDQVDDDDDDDDDDGDDDDIGDEDVRTQQLYMQAAGARSMGETDGDGVDRSGH